MQPVWINKELHKRFKVAAAMQGKSMVEIVEGLINAFLRELSSEEDTPPTEKSQERVPA